MNKRKTEISVLNVLFCLLVMYIHCTGAAVAMLPFFKPSRTILYTTWKIATFVVQGFIFLSGLKHFIKEDTVSYPRFLLKKFKTIFLPYTIWCIIYYTAFVIAGTYKFNILNLIKGIFTGTISAHFYYIIALMQFFILFPMWKRLFQKDNILIVLPAMILISTLFTEGLPVIVNLILPNHSFVYNDRMFTTYLVYWALGCYAGLYYTEFKAILIKYRLFICIMFSLSAIGNVCLPYIAEKNLYSMFFISDMQTLYSISAILFTYMLSITIKDSRIANCRLVAGIDKSSYTIYLCHFLILFCVDAILIKTALSNMHLKATAIRLAVVVPLSILISMLYTKITKK